VQLHFRGWRPYLEKNPSFPPLDGSCTKTVLVSTRGTRGIHERATCPLIRLLFRANAIVADSERSAATSADRGRSMIGPREKLSSPITPTSYPRTATLAYTSVHVCVAERSRPAPYTDPSRSCGRPQAGEAALAKREKREDRYRFATFAPAVQDVPVAASATRSRTVRDLRDLPVVLVRPERILAPEFRSGISLEMIGDGNSLRTDGRFTLLLTLSRSVCVCGY